MCILPRFICLCKHFLHNFVRSVSDAKAIGLMRGIRL
nr:MAG TPA: hypothetical protein [Caudoviricetes sp.]